MSFKKFTILKFTKKKMKFGLLFLVKMKIKHDLNWY